MALSTLLADDDIFPGFNPFRSLMTGDGASPGLRPIPIDVIEKDDKFEIKADLPGVDRADVRVSADGDVLTIAVEAKKEGEKEEDVAGFRVHRIERRQQFVTRRVRLPDSADMGQITAKMDNGTLVVSIPKNPDKVKQRQIDVS